MTYMVRLLQERVELVDPHDCTDRNDELSILDGLFDALVRRGVDGGFVPALAESWEVDEDAKVWTFRLRDGLRFHDGSVLDARSAAFSIRRMARPDRGATLGAPAVYAPYLGDASVEAEDARTLRVSLARPIADLLDILVYGYVLPDSVEADPDGFLARPIGSGAYRATEYRPGIRLDAEAFADHWAGPPPNPAIAWIAEPDAERRLAALSGGDAEVAARVGGAGFGARQRAWEDVDRVDYLSPTTVIYMMNTAKGPLRDPRLRLAVNLGIDRPRLVERVLGGAGMALMGFVSPAHFGADTASDALDHDPARARRLMAEAGYGDGLNLLIDRPTSLPDEAGPLTEEVRDQLAVIGIACEIRVTEDRVAYANRVRLKDVGDLCLFDSSPLSTFRVLHEKIDSRTAGAWWQGYGNAAIEDLVDRARATPGTAAREAIYRETYRLLQADPAWLYLYNNMHTMALAGRHPGRRMRIDGVIDVTALPAFSRG